ncbi:kelch repeat-containing protein [Sorangium sp. So ce185]|uniref:Kelch repeat-containing protein n=1 Tax=Sorangium sp. So ce185 TaxID=3133287 RepID=UPI003F6153E9
MTGFSFSASIGSLRCRGLTPGALALLSLPWTAAGCADQGGIDAVEGLRAHFPEQQQLVIGAGDGFARAADGLKPRRTDDDARAVRRELRLVLPGDGGGALRFELPGGFEARVTELGASGEASILGTSVAYARGDGEAAFWTTTGDGGYEEWLYLPPAARSAGAPLASWRVEGAALRRRGDLVELLDAAGRPRVRVTAPVAYGAGGRPLEARLDVDGDRITLGVEGARGEPLLIDPVWTLAASMLSPREGHSATLLHDGRVLVAGGRDGGGSCMTSAELYDPASDAWTPAASMGETRCWHPAILLEDGRVLVGGGGSEERRSVEIYDPAADRWAQAAPMIDARASFPAVLLADGRVLVAGAARSDARSAEVYDPVADTWAPAASMLHPRRDHSATLLLDGRVLVAGGHLAVWPEPSRPSAEIYDPATDAWASATDMNSSHSWHTAMRLPDGRVFLLDMGSLLNTQAETYDPAAGTWTGGPGLTGLHAGLYGGPSDYALSSLGDGRVLATGGLTMDTGACGTIDSCDETIYWMLHDIVQVYDPATNVSSHLSPMQLVRVSHSSTVLPDGRVLIAGGSSAPPLPPGHLPNVWLPSETVVTATTEISSPMGTRGAPCASSAECAGAPCVDGVCCDRACEGACEACSVAAGAAQDGTCSPASRASCDDGDACTEADTCVAGVCRGVPLDAGPCSGGSGAGGSGGATSSTSAASSGSGGDTGEGGHAGSTGDGGSTGATSTSAASSGSGGDTGEGAHAGSTGDGGSTGAASTSTASSGSGGDTGEGGHAGSTGDGGSTGAASSTSAASSGSGGESADGSTACSASASVGSSRAGTPLGAAWLAALGLLAWSRRRGAHPAVARGALAPDAPSTTSS